jgi:tRNA(fMet)-specific endonuclease VapC
LPRQVLGYERALAYQNFIKGWRILPFDQRAAAECARLRSAKIRTGTNDLKIASIALVNNALLLSANLRDFRTVPGLRVESWI